MTFCLCGHDAGSHNRLRFNCLATNDQNLRCSCRRYAPASAPAATPEPERCVECGATDTVLARGEDGKMRCLRNPAKRWPRPVVPDNPPAAPTGEEAEQTFDRWYSQPCDRCGGRRDYRADGQMQVVCFRCANPPAPPTGEEAETLHAAASDLRHIANGGSCAPETLLAHADALLAQATALAALRKESQTCAEDLCDAWEEIRRLRAALAPRQTTGGHEHG